MLPAWTAEQRGSSTAEFILTATMLTFFILALIQLGVVLMMRASLMDAASAGARQAALADQDTAAGQHYAQILAEQSLPAASTATVRAAKEHGQVTVTVNATVPLVGLVPTQIEMSFTGHASTHFSHDD